MLKVTLDNGRGSRSIRNSDATGGFAAVLPAVVLMAVMLSSCATTEGVKGGAKSGGPPRWAYDLKAVYPDSEWLAVAEQAGNRQNAESAAINALARIFGTDVLGVTNAYMEYTQAITSTKSKKISSLDESREFAQNVTTTASVSGLIGVVTESVKDGSGVWWANARMNRAECAAVYAKTVRENEKIIADLRSDAAAYPGTLDAYADLRFAVIVAEVTDDLQSKLAILDNKAARRGVDYGNTDALRAEAMNIARSIVIDVQVSGDNSGRLASALSSFFTKQGFRVGPGGEYTLPADYTTENVDLPNNRGYLYIRYAFQAALRDRAGKDVFAWSDNGREGHLTEADVHQRALRAVENAIAAGNFAQDFDRYLDSLL
jgi:predicted small secreted protein